MTRLLLVAMIGSALLGSTATAAVLKFVSTRIVGSRAVFDIYGKPSPLTAYYILDEDSDSDERTCTRVLLSNPTGHFVSDVVPLAFCE